MILCFVLGLVGAFVYGNIDIALFKQARTTFRLDSMEKNGLEWVKDIGKKNLEDMLQLIQWNEDNVRILASLNNQDDINKISGYQIYAALFYGLPIRLALNSRI